MSVGSENTSFPVAQLKQMVISSFCEFSLKLERTGYFNTCQINTYMLALPQVLLLIYTVPKLGNAAGGGAIRSRLKNFKMGLAAAHVAATSLYGPEIFNIISLSVSYCWLFIAFVCAFMELNGLFIPRKALLGYYFVCAFSYGYYICAAVAKRADLPTDPRIHAALILFLSSFANATTRDIGDSVESNEKPDGTRIA